VKARKASLALIMGAILVSVTQDIWPAEHWLNYVWAAFLAAAVASLWISWRPRS
jgi:hypothetical protein